MIFAQNPSLNMKVKIVIIGLLFFAFTLNAEVTLRGIVTYQNTGVKMKAIQVTARGASPTITRKDTTNTEGVFVLTFPNGKVGDVVYLELGTPIYDLVNDKRDLEIVLTDKTDYKVRLVVCKKGERDANAVAYYNISTKYLETSYQKQIKKKESDIANLQKQLTQSGANTDALNKQIYALQSERAKLDDQLEAQKKNAYKLAENFSRIDLAQADAIYRKAFETFKAGDIDSARAVLNSKEAKQQEVELKKRDTDIQKSKENIEQAKDNIKQAELKVAIAEQERNSLKASVIKKKMLDGHLAELQLKFDEAEKLLEEAVELDKKDIQNVISFAYFLKSINKLDKSLKVFYDLALPLRKDDFYQSTVLTEISNIYFEKNHYENSESILRNAILLKEKSIPFLPKDFVIYYAKDLVNLARLLFKSEKIDSVGILLFRAKVLFDNFSKDTTNLILKSYQADTYKFIGDYYVKKNLISNADSFYHLSIQLYRSLSNQESTSLLANSLLNYGNFCTRFSFYKKADSSLNEGLEIYQNLAKSNPYLYNSPVADAFQNLGNLYKHWKRFDTMDNLDYSERYLIISMRIREQLYAIDTTMYKPDLARNYGDIVGLYFMRDSFIKAEKYALLSLHLFESLCDTNYLFFYKETSVAYRNLGVLYGKMNIIDKSLYYLLISLKFYEKLNEKNIDVYEDRIADLFYSIGLIYRDCNQKLLSLENLKKSEIKYRTLNDKFNKIYFKEWFYSINELIECIEDILKQNIDIKNNLIYIQQISEYKNLMERLSGYKR